MNFGIQELRSFSRPMVASSATMSLDSLVTTYCLSHYSETAMCASLPAAALASMFTTVAIAFLSYSGTIVARYHGSGRDQLAAHSFVQGLWLYVFSLPLFGLAGLVSHYALRAFGHSGPMLASEAPYTVLLLISGALQSLATVLAGFFFGRGETRFPGAVLTLGCLFDICLAPLFILKFRLGIMGAGWARIFSMAFPCAFLLAAVLRDPLLARRKNPRHAWRFIPQLARELVGLTAPNALRLLIDCGGFFILTALIGTLKPVFVAASTLVFIVNSVFCAILRSVSNGVELLRAQFHAQADATRVLITTAFKLMSIYLAVYFVIILGFSGTITACFHNPDSTFGEADLHTVVIFMLPILVIRELLETIQLILMAVLKGMGDTGGLLTIQIFVTFLVWMPLLAFIRLLNPTLTAYWLSMLVYMLAFVLLLAHRIGSNRSGKVPNSPFLRLRNRNVKEISHPLETSREIREDKITI